MARTLKPWFASTLLFLLGLSVLLPGWVDRWHPTWDSAVYLTLARNAHHGEGYVYAGQPHVKYPPGFPLLLAPFAGEPGDSVRAERLLLIVCALLATQVLYHASRRQLGSAAAFAVALALGANETVLWHTIRILSDVPFLVLWLLSLWMGSRLIERPTPGRAMAQVLAFTAAFAVRVVALFQWPVLCFVAVRTLLTRREGRGWLVAATLGCLVAPAVWFGRAELLRPELDEARRDVRSYVFEWETGEDETMVHEPPSLGRRLELVARNAEHYRDLLAESVSGGLTSTLARDGEAPWERWLRLGVGYGLLVVMVLALLPLVRRGFGYWVACMFVYLLGILAWPSMQGARFLLPILPWTFLAWLALSRCKLETAGFRLACLGLPIVTIGCHVGASAWAEMRGDSVRERTDAVGLVRREWQEPYHEPLRDLFIACGAYVARELPEARLAADDAAYLVFAEGIDARSFPILSTEPVPWNAEGLAIVTAEGRRLLAWFEREGITHVLFVPEGRFTHRNLTLPLLYPLPFAPGWPVFRDRHPALALLLEEKDDARRQAAWLAVKPEDLVVPVTSLVAAFPF